MVMQHFLGSGVLDVRHFNLELARGGDIWQQKLVWTAECKVDAEEMAIKEHAGKKLPT